MTNKIDNFVSDPFTSVHPIYKNSPLHMRPAVETANGEMLLASFYRQLGYEKVKEGQVPANGRVLRKQLMKENPKNLEKTSSTINARDWREILTRVLNSPKNPNQSKSRFLQIAPIIPQPSIYCLSARLTTNPWPIGVLPDLLIKMGCPSEEAANNLKRRAFEALSVDDDDDIWAQILQKEFEATSPFPTINWNYCGDTPWTETLKSWHAFPIDCPAKQFVRDLERVLKLKPKLTRRQWTSSLESLLRIGAASYICWICKFNISCLEMLRAALDGRQPKTNCISHKISKLPKFIYGQYAAAAIKTLAVEFLWARVSINLILLFLEEAGVVSTNDNSCLANESRIHEFANNIYTQRARVDTKRLELCLEEIREKHPAKIAGKKGIANNVKEFLTYILSQRATNEKGLDSYDQSYFLRKKTKAVRSRWIFSMGPVSVLTLVHALAGDSTRPQTVSNLCQHLAKYGMHIEPQDLPTSSLGITLRSLGLVLDSPDAEGGMVVLSPFNISKRKPL